MRRIAARIGLVAALALSMGVAAVNAPSARAEEPGLVSAPRADNDEMNYAINLAGTDPEELQRALALVPGAGGAALASYPEIGTFFAQSATPSFAPDLAAALRQAGIAIHSIGPTRVAPVLYYERVELPTDKKDKGPQSGVAGGLTSMREESASAAPAGTNEEVFNWGAVAMHAREAEAVNVKRAPVTVAVVDSGVEDTHPDLEGRVDTSRSVKCSVNGVATQDFYGWRDEFYHGTHVAGIIAANHNDIGIDGIAPEASIVAIEATNDNRLIYPEYVTCAFMWAASHGVDVVNNSYSMDPWVYWSPTDPEQAAGLEAATRSIKYAQDKGLAVIAAAGNEGVDIDNPTVDNGSPTDVPTPTKNRAVNGGIRVPSMLDGVAQVSAVGQAYNVKPGLSLGRAEFSNYGDTIDFAAPGDQIYSTVPLLFYPSGYAVADGTSMATPHVSGIAALIKSVHPELTGAQVIDLMKKQAAANYGRLNAPIDGREYRGYGFLDALDAVTSGVDQIDEAKAGAWVKDAVGWWYRYEDGSYPASMSAQIDGATYRFDARGYMVTGWAFDGGQWFYHGASGAQVAGWANVNGTWYYLDPASGVMATGWVFVSGTWYYLGASGAMATGWAYVDGAWYYLAPSGAMAIGWLHEGGSWYYLDPATGVMVTGSQQVNGVAYTFGPDGRMR
ncbi:S8 family serine peptidase [Pauljensenia sp. UMB3104]|uniref:S8 family serine peptidase n=1 Tax=Pauljensenia sp. UMB3104 TaxID=3046331 RepID=UPI00254BB1E2|nr:S8 family serine peptidase [Pauljensenia sp. UMB3104]MDK7160178.1 S8 family serine peptidase [Pauljensenia sp. UMB3104]